MTDQPVGYSYPMTDVVAEFIGTSAGDVALHVRGDGPVILLLHANPGSADDFAGVVGELAARYRVIAVDWPGYGASPMPLLNAFEGAISYRDCLIEMLDFLTDSRG
jgi:pimeloyl-ACP methyl ester carboxylesterase